MATSKTDCPIILTRATLVSPKRGTRRGTRIKVDAPTATPANPKSRLRCQGWAENFSITNRVEDTVDAVKGEIEQACHEQQPTQAGFAGHLEDGDNRIEILEAHPGSFPEFDRQRFGQDKNSQEDI